MGQQYSFYRDNMRGFLYLLGFIFLILAALSMTLEGAVIFVTLGIMSLAASSKASKRKIQK